MRNEGLTFPIPLFSCLSVYPAMYVDITAGSFSTVRGTRGAARMTSNADDSDIRREKMQDSAARDWNSSTRCSYIWT